MLARELKKLLNQKKKGIKTFLEVPEPKMRLYAFYSTNNKYFFTTEDEFILYARANYQKYNRIFIVEYLGKFAGKQDVIKLVDSSGGYNICTPSFDGYEFYEEKKSLEKGKAVWNFHYGSLEDIYTEFKNRGIILEEDIYQKIDDCRKKFYKKYQK